jgi:hypothetical protein
MRIFHKSIREMKIHKRTQHEPDESKCDLCAFGENDRTSLRKDEEAKHENIVLECKQCEYKRCDTCAVVVPQHGSSHRVANK